MDNTKELQAIRKMLKNHSGLHTDIPRETMIRIILDRREAIPASCGALVVWTPPESTGRSPKDTVSVRRPESEAGIDWDSPNNIGIAPDTFDMLLEDALDVMKDTCELFEVNRVVGADSRMALPVCTISTHCISTLFADLDCAGSDGRSYEQVWNCGSHHEAFSRRENGSDIWQRAFPTCRRRGRCATQL